jgi:hypothetical protein
MGPCMKLMVQLPMPREHFKLSPLWNDKHSHRRHVGAVGLKLSNLRCNPFRQLPWRIDEHPFSGQISLHDRVTWQTVR